MTAQTHCALHEIYLGHRTHQSSRYRVSHDGREERQSSSGVIASELDEGGVIFGDGLEDDRLRVGWGMRVQVTIARQRSCLVIRVEGPLDPRSASS